MGRGAKGVRPNGTTPTKDQSMDDAMGGEDDDSLAEETAEAARELHGFFDEVADVETNGEEEKTEETAASRGFSMGDYSTKKGKKETAWSTASEKKKNKKKKPPSKGDDGKKEEEGGRAKFAPGTAFKQKKTPGQMKSNKKRKDKEEEEEEEDREYSTIFRVLVRVTQCEDVDVMITQILAEGLKILQARDKLAWYYNPVTGKIARNLKELPTDFMEIRDEWMKWDQVLKDIKPTIRAGKTRRLQGSITVLSNVEPKELLRKATLAMAKNLPGGTGQSISFSYKENQVLRTSRNLMLMGVPNNVDREGLAVILRKMVNKARGEMVIKNPTKYPKEKYLSGEGLPSFVLVREFAQNAPWEERDENEDLPGWAKMIIHVEVAEKMEYLLRDCLQYLVKTGELNLHFGEFAWLVVNPGGDATLAEKQALGLDIEQHTAVMLCVGKVHLQGVRDENTPAILI